MSIDKLIKLADRYYLPDEIVEQREIDRLSFVEKFPLAKLKDLSIDQFVQGTDDNSFCYWLELKKIEGPLSNHEKLSQTTIQTMCNLLNIWQNGDQDVKGQFIKAIFPSGIVVARENSHYRTENLNPAIQLISELMGHRGQTKKRNKMDLPTYSALVGVR